jgi:hypothetical protein
LDASRTRFGSTEPHSHHGFTFSLKLMNPRDACRIRRFASDAKTDANKAGSSLAPSAVMSWSSASTVRPSGPLEHVLDELVRGLARVVHGAQVDNQVLANHSVDALERAGPPVTDQVDVEKRRENPKVKVWMPESVAARRPFEDAEPLDRAQVPLTQVSVEQLQKGWPRAKRRVNAVMNRRRRMGQRESQKSLSPTPATP